MGCNMNKTSTQLALGIHLPDDMAFDNYYVGKNEAAVAYVKKLCAEDNVGWIESLIYLWGNKGAGNSHLLQAACLQFQLTGRQAIYLPLKELVCYSPEILEDLEHYDLVCLDDIQVIEGNRSWQEALFYLFNRLREVENYLLIGANKAPRELALDLQDLKSRFMLALVFQLQSLSDDDKLKALQLRASLRGMVLSDEVARFILSRGERDMNSLFALLDRLDKASLMAKHKLTIPFVKQVFAW